MLNVDHLQYILETDLHMHSAYCTCTCKDASILVASNAQEESKVFLDGKEYILANGAKRGKSYFILLLSDSYSPHW